MERLERLGVERGRGLGWLRRRADLVFKYILFWLRIAFDDCLRSVFRILETVQGVRQLVPSFTSRKLSYTLQRSSSDTLKRLTCQERLMCRHDNVRKRQQTRESVVLDGDVAEVCREVLGLVIIHI